MSGEAPFLADILQGHGNCDGKDDFSASDAGSFDDNDAEQFSTATIQSAEDESHSDHSSTQPTDVHVSVPPSAPRASNMFRQKSRYKIHLPHPSSPPLQMI
jgi:hypothetical protein